MGLCEDGADREWPDRPIYSDLGEELPSALQFDCDCAHGHIQEYGDCGVEWDDVRQEEKMVLTLGEWDFEGDDCGGSGARCDLARETNQLQRKEA